MRTGIARALVIAGSVLLIASAALHGVAGFTAVFPALNASNLAAALKPAMRVIFLLVAWHWLVFAVLALLARACDTSTRRRIVLICGFALLLEAIGGAAAMGLFIGNEMIGAAGILLLCGAFLSNRADLTATDNG
ncbi:MAG: hypothetical protein ACRD1Y_01850 [Terriglobales bacterium]